MSLPLPSTAHKASPDSGSVERVSPPEALPRMRGHYLPHTLLQMSYWLICFENSPNKLLF